MDVTRLTQLSEDQQAEYGNKLDELRKVSQEFGSIFNNILLKSMRATVSEGGILSKSNGEKIFESMLDSEYSQLMARRGLGLGDSIFNHLKSLLDMIPDEGMSEVIDRYSAIQQAGSLATEGTVYEYVKD